MTRRKHRSAVVPEAASAADLNVKLKLLCNRCTYSYQWPITILLLALLNGCAGYVPGEKAHWDGQIKELCDKDGHVQVLEPLALSRQQAESMSLGNGKFRLLMQLGGEPIAEPAFARIEKQSYLNDRNPVVRRSEIVAVRQSDRKVVARWVVYSRIGGDPKIGLAHDSSFLCPDQIQIQSELQTLFQVRE
jgi:hypothetical protein